MARWGWRDEGEGARPPADTRSARMARKKEVASAKGIDSGMGEGRTKLR